jgi:hypothetical protein
MTFDELFNGLESIIPVDSGEGYYDDYGCVIQFGWHRHCGWLIFALNDRHRADEIMFDYHRWMNEQWPDLFNDNSIGKGSM